MMYASTKQLPIARMGAYDRRVWNDALQATVLALACNDTDPLRPGALIDGDPGLDCKRKECARCWSSSAYWRLSAKQTAQRGQGKSTCLQKLRSGSGGEQVRPKVSTGDDQRSWINASCLDCGRTLSYEVIGWQVVPQIVGQTREPS